jgi:hypothetical protein
MSKPTRPRVTIDDRITRIEKASVSLEVVERVERDIFYTTGFSVPLAHYDEDATWLRGHFMLDSKEVEAARAAQALSDKPAEAAAMPLSTFAEILRKRRENQQMLEEDDEGIPQRIPGNCPGIVPTPHPLWPGTLGPRYKLGS